ncbi:MAG: hypothetical protein JXM73_21995 [Anaerolineae bacterium]|nr:hypothetical protein [Anaerolineae bacterium]
MTEELGVNSEAKVTGVEVTADDRLWAALSWIPVSPLFPLISILMLLMDEKKDRPFIRYNAVLSLAASVALMVLAIPTFGLAAIGFLLFFWWAYQSYQGQVVEIPVLSEWIREQGWA